MTAMVTTTHQPVFAPVLSGISWTPAPDVTDYANPLDLISRGSGVSWTPTPELTSYTEDRSLAFPTLEFAIHDFELKFGGTLLALQLRNDFGEAVFRGLVDDEVQARLTLKNQPVNGLHESLRIESASLNFDVAAHRAKPLFVSESLYAAVGLGGEVRAVLKDAGLDAAMQFSVSNSVISKALQRRQIYFGLLVIERATGIKFEIPAFIPGDQIESISYVYNAIITKSFPWLCNEIVYNLPATAESFAWLRAMDSSKDAQNSFKLAFDPTPDSRTILGNTIALGDLTIFLDDAVIDNFETVHQQISRLDGELVRVVIKPRSRQARYDLPGAPNLPEEPWDEIILTCVSLEDELNRRLANRYNSLAAATLSGLTAQESASFMELPQLDLDAYLMSE